MSSEVVYWGLTLDQEQEERSFFLAMVEPVPVITFLKKIRDDANITPDTRGGDFLRCPALLGSIKNTFAVLSPIDLVIEWDGQRISTKNYDQYFFEKFIFLRDTSKGFISISIGTLAFFSESSMNMRYTATNFSKTDFFKKTTLLTGDYNIGEWFRPLDVGFLIDEPCTISIKKGDPLFYIKFETENNIVFKKFFFDENLERIQKMCMRMKNYAQGWPVVSYLENMYKLFKASKIKSLILKHIKNNLLS